MVFPFSLKCRGAENEIATPQPLTAEKNITHIQKVNGNAKNTSV